MTFVQSAGALAWQRCALRSFSPSLALSSLCRLRRRARVSPYLACACLHVWAYHLPFLCPRACWFVCSVAAVCAPRLRVAPFFRFRGFPVSYHHFFPLGLPIRYSLIPLMFRSAVLAAFCSLCVLWRCQPFPWRRQPKE